MGKSFLQFPHPTGVVSVVSYKQVIVLRRDLPLTRQVVTRTIAYGSVRGVQYVEQRNPDLVKRWLKVGQKKITTQVTGRAELESLAEHCDRRALLATLVTLPPDLVKVSGVGEEEPVILVVGPDKEVKIDPVTGTLKLY